MDVSAYRVEWHGEVFGHKARTGVLFLGYVIFLLRQHSDERDKSNTMDTYNGWKNHQQCSDYYFLVVTELATDQYSLIEEPFVAHMSINRHQLA